MEILARAISNTTALRPSLMYFALSGL